MTMSRIKIFGEPTPPPVAQPMPLERSLQWVSPHEQLVPEHVQVFFSQSALAACIAHASAEMAHEVGGWLIGESRRDPQRARPYVVIQDILPALHTDAGQTHVTFTRETMIQFQGEIEERFPHLDVVGWYHTHPRLGVFLSSYDTWLHENLFGDPSQVALVIDPVFQQGGFFCWQPDRLLDPVHYVGFCELGEEGADSIVDWENLEPVVEQER
jgi:proteasome lid subunit RPN8/RPN11